MPTFNFSIPLVDIDGKTVTSNTLASVLATVIGQQTQGNTLKLFGWMQNLQAGKHLLLDESDRKDLAHLIESDIRIFLYAKVQLLKILEPSAY